MKIIERVVDGAASVGLGLLAGAVGTAAMTMSSTVEMKLRDRPSSNAPADAAAELLGVKPVDDKAQARFGNVVHWAYGTGWGAVRGLLGAAGLRGPAAAGAHLAAVWGSEQVVLPATGVAGPAWTWGAKEVAIDLLHHLVYVSATGVTYGWLDRHRSR